MAATNGTVIGQFRGTSWATAFTNPQQLDILQVLSITGGTVKYNLTRTGVANTNPVSPTRVHGNPQALYQQNGAASLAAAFTNPLHLDLIQIISPTGGNIVAYVDYLGVVH